MLQYHATPSVVTKPDGSTLTPENVLSWLLHETEKGCSVDLESGHYPAPGIVKRTRPATIRGPVDRTAVIDRGNSDTIFFASAQECGDLTLESLLILGSYRSVVMFKASEQPHYFTKFAFINCALDGGYNFETRDGESTKWGIMGHRTNDLKFIGGAIRNIREEHCVYLHNTGPKRHLFRDCVLENAGRTLIQVVARPKENGGSPSLAAFDLINVVGKSAGLADGGSAFTFSGNAGRVTFNGVSYEHGFDSALKDYLGTGAIVIWPEYDGSEEHPGTPNGDVVIVNSQFRFAPGYGKAPLARFSAAQRLVIGSSQFECGANPIALDIDPVDGGMAGAKFPVKQFMPLIGTVNNTILGRVLIGGTELKIAAA